ncbi:hypothetical protein Syun_010303 [Stephania yunnanensis]|uniref:Uncharacterized protein n=1 Tax=Stephania yunnanensis TaxID=152371 RepID=A0AAP0PRH9_9MAGN
MRLPRIGRLKEKCQQQTTVQLRFKSRQWQIKAGIFLIQKQINCSEVITLVTLPVPYDN